MTTLHAVGEAIAAAAIAAMVVIPAVELHRQRRDSQTLRDGRYARRHRVKGTRP